MIARIKTWKTCVMRMTVIQTMAWILPTRRNAGEDPVGNKRTPNAHRQNRKRSPQAPLQTRQAHIESTRQRPLLGDSRVCAPSVLDGADPHARSELANVPGSFSASLSKSQATTAYFAVRLSRPNAGVAIHALFDVPISLRGRSAESCAKRCVLYSIPARIRKTCYPVLTLLGRADTLPDLPA